MLVNESEGTRTWTVWGPTREELLRRVTLVFAEHVDVHISYNTMQTGWTNHPPQRPDDPPFTELHFEYSALIITRPRAPKASGRASG